MACQRDILEVVLACAANDKSVSHWVLCSPACSAGLTSVADLRWWAGLNGLAGSVRTVMPVLRLRSSSGVEMAPHHASQGARQTGPLPQLACPVTVAVPASMTVAGPAARRASLGATPVLRRNREGDLSMTESSSTRPTTTPAPGTFRLDPDRATIRVDGKGMFGLAPVHGTMRLVSGEVTITDDPGRSSVRAVIDAASFSSGNSKRDKDVTSANLLDAQSYPEITFSGEGARAQGGGWVVPGTVTAHGVPVPAELTIDDVPHRGRRHPVPRRRHAGSHPVRRNEDEGHGRPYGQRDRRCGRRSRLTPTRRRRGPASQGRQPGPSVLVGRGQPVITATTVLPGANEPCPARA